jgi:hypothetical protein
VLTANVTIGTLVHIEALAIGVSLESFRTRALVAARAVTTNRIQTTFSGRTMHLIAFININTTGSNVAGIISPTFFADAVRFLSFRFAKSVLSTRDVLTWSFTLDLRRCANKTGLAFALKRTGSVDTRGIRATCVGNRSTLIDIDTRRALRFKSILAEALLVNTLGIVGTIEVALTQHANVTLNTSRAGVRFTFETLWANAVVTWIGVFAHCMIAARLVQCGALINVDTSVERIASVVWLAGTRKTSNRVRADSVRSTRILFTFVNI